MPPSVAWVPLCDSNYGNQTNRQTCKNATWVPPGSKYDYQINYILCFNIGKLRGNFLGDLIDALAKVNSLPRGGSFPSNVYGREWNVWADGHYDTCTLRYVIWTVGAGERIRIPSQKINTYLETSWEMLSNYMLTEQSISAHEFVFLSWVTRHGKA